MRVGGISSDPQPKQPSCLVKFSSSSSVLWLDVSLLLFCWKSGGVLQTFAHATRVLVVVYLKLQFVLVFGLPDESL